MVNANGSAGAPGRYATANVYSVSQVSAYIKSLFVSDMLLADVWLSGGGVRVHPGQLRPLLFYAEGRGRHPQVSYLAHAGRRHGLAAQR